MVKVVKEVNKYEPLSVANLLINLAIENDAPISNLHLQKTLYYLQAFYLSRTSSPIINAQFSRWPYGPVIKSVYHAFSQYGASAILEPLKEDGIFFDEGTIPEIEVSIFHPFEQEVVPFLKKLFNMIPWELVEKTHEQKIWFDYKDSIQSYSAPDYTEEEISKQFKNVSEQLWN